MNENQNQNSESKKIPKYLVWNLEEMLQVCTPQDLSFVDNIIDRMLRYREENNLPSVKEFTVLTPEDPYYAEVIEIIKRYKGG